MQLGATSRNVARQRFLAVLGVALPIVSLLYLAKGFDYLLFLDRGAGDLHLRWVEQHYVMSGRNPYDVFFASDEGASGRRPLWSARDASVIPTLGVPRGVVYPAWAYFTGMAFYSIPWPAERIYFAAISLIALAILAVWAYGVGRPSGRLAGIVLASSFTAMAAISNTLELGQYGLVVMALLAGALWFCRRHKPLACGLAMGAALAKPNISLLFLLPLAARRCWLALGTTVIYNLLASAVVWAMIRTNPVESALQWLRATRGFYPDYWGPINIAVRFGLSQALGARLTMIGYGALAVILIWLWRRGPMVTLAAVAAVIGRLWVYHLVYDNLMILFLLIAIGELALRTFRPVHLMAYLLVGISLWIPSSAYLHAWFQMFQTLTWLGGLAVLLAATPREMRQEASSPQGPIVAAGPF